MVSCPEFLREGSALADFMNPDRVVLGSLDREAAEKVAQLHLPLRAPIVVTDLRTAEMIKYASNAFLATRISFINEIATICEKLGADVKEVAAGMGYDKRIGRAFLDAGVGYGGSVLPQGRQGAGVHGPAARRASALLRAVMEINRDQRRLVVHKLRELLGTLRRANGSACWAWRSSRTPTTCARRPASRSPTCCCARARRCGATTRSRMRVAERVMPELSPGQEPLRAGRGLRCAGPGDRVERVQASRPGARPRSLMRTPVFVDGRNVYEPEVMWEAGFLYRGIGRGYNRAHAEE